MRRASALLRKNIELLSQGMDLLDRIDDETYAGTPAIAGSPVGSHLRHAIDLYVCFLDGLPGRRFDYDARHRDEALSSRRSVAREFLGSLQGRLETLVDELDDGVVEVRMDCQEGEDDLWCESTVSRELQFLQSHTVHHYALISTLLRLRGIDPGAEFGVAPATLVHERRQLAAR